MFTFNQILGLIGQVTDVYEDKDLRICIGDKTWTLNPACCVPFDLRNSAQHPSSCRGQFILVLC